MRDSEILTHAANTWGIHLEGTQGLLHEGRQAWRSSYALACDAQPTLLTAPNAGIPAYLTMYQDPNIIEVLTTPMRIGEILGETKKGDWVTDTASFPKIEYTGETSSYGDYSNNGRTGANADWTFRQSYHYQTITEWGEKQLARYGEARIDYAARLNVASALVLNKFQNRTYAFGVAGLLNYGILNDPSLPAPIQPSLKTAGGRAWIQGGVIVATANEVYGDIQSLYYQLVKQTQGWIDLDMSSKMTLVMDPGSEVALTATNNFNVSVKDLLAKNFPGMRFMTEPLYATAAGNVVQLIADDLNGEQTGYAAYTEKMRAHGVVKELSSFKEKKSQGTWGTIIRMPLAFAQMLGV